MEIFEIINSLGCGGFQVMLYFICGINFSQEASCLMAMTFLLDSLQAYWNLSPFEKSTINSFVFVGICVGYISFGFLSDRIGRKPIIIFMSFIMILGAILSSICYYFWMLYVCVFVIGVGAGASGIPMTLYAEYLPRKFRGAALQFLGLFWTSGCIYEAVIAWCFLYDGVNIGNRWRICLLFSVIPFLVQIFLFPFLPESIRFLSLGGHEKEVKKIVHRMQCMNCKRLPKEVEIKLSECPEKRGRITDLFKKEIFVLFLNIIVIWTLLTFVYYGTLQSVPDFFPKYKYLGFILTSLSEVPALIFTAIILNYIGRKYVLFINVFIACNCFILLLIPKEIDVFVLRVILILFLRGSVLSASSVVWVLAEETLPSNIRTSGIGIANIIAKTGAIASPYVSKMLTKNNSFYPKIIYGAVSLIASVLIIFHPHETKGKEMVEYFGGENKENMVINSHDLQLNGILYDECEKNFV